tara:strand:- start:278 stop:703 length:426 start_codon:yes stop_codon:yes gene_type:complete
MNKTLTFLLICLTTFTFGQNTEKIKHFEQKNVTINIIQKDCINKQKGIEKQYYFIEIINNNPSSVNISFKKEVWYNNVCQSCNSQSNEYKVNITVAANSSVIGDCNSDNKSLSIFSKMLNLDKVRKLSKYELKNINVEIIK